MYLNNHPQFFYVAQNANLYENLKDGPVRLEKNTLHKLYTNLEKNNIAWIASNCVKTDEPMGTTFLLKLYNIV